MHTAEEVAKWMVAKFDIAKYLYQEQVVYEIRTHFG